MSPEQHEIVRRMRRRAFRSRNVRNAIQLLALAEEVRSMQFASPPRAMLVMVRAEDGPMPDIDPPPLRRECSAWWDGESLLCHAAPCRSCPHTRPSSDTVGSASP